VRAEFTAVPGGVDVPTADEEQAVERIQEIISFRHLAGRQDRGPRAGTTECVEIGSRHAVPTLRPARNAAWFEAVRGDGYQRPSAVHPRQDMRSAATRPPNGPGAPTNRTRSLQPFSAPLTVGAQSRRNDVIVITPYSSSTPDTASTAIRTPRNLNRCAIANRNSTEASTTVVRM